MGQAAHRDSIDSAVRVGVDLGIDNLTACFQQHVVPHACCLQGGDRVRNFGGMHIVEQNEAWKMDLVRALQGLKRSRRGKCAVLAGDLDLNEGGLFAKGPGPAQGPRNGLLFSISP